MDIQKMLNIFVSFVFLVAIVKVNGEPKVPCYFIFGDSLVDSGNNNNLATTSKVNYYPYGIDFPGGPTGRFTNGRTAADIIGEQLGFENYIPSFLNVSTSATTDILKGVNYASGSAGILPETGKKLGDNIDLARQLQNHQNIISRIVEKLGSEAAAQHLNKCLYSIVIGSNDYINNYFKPESYDTSRRHTTSQYAEFLIQAYSQHVKSLHKLGARKVSLTGVAPIGCMPSAIALKERKGALCVDAMNNAANIFNRRLRSLVGELNANLTDAKFVFLNTYGIVPKYLSVPGFGFQIDSCCNTNEFDQCVPNEEPCKLRNFRLFYDGFHPTEIFNKAGAAVSYLPLLSIL